MRNWPKKAWAWVRGSPRPRPPFFFAHLSVSILLFAVSFRPDVAVFVLVPLSAAAFLGLYRDIVSKQRSYRFATCLCLIGVAGSVPVLTERPEVLLVHFPLAVFYTYGLHPLPAGLLLLAALACVGLSTTPLPLLVATAAGLIAIYLPMSWWLARGRRHLDRLEEKLARLLSERESESARRKAGTDFSPPAGDLMETVHEVSEVSRDIDDILYLIKAALSAHTVAFLSVDGSQIRMKNHNSDSPLLEELHSDGDGCLRAILNERRPVQIDDIQSRRLLPPYYGSPVPVRSFLGIPVLDGNVVIGLLVADKTDSPAFTPSEYETLSRSANQITGHLRRSKIVRAVGSTADSYKSLYGLGSRILSTIKVESIADHLLDAVHAIVDPDVSALFVIQSGRLKLAGIRGHSTDPDEDWDAEGTILSWIARHGQEYQTSDLDKRPVEVLPFPVPDLKCFLGLPLMLNTDTCIGVLAIGFRHPEAITARHSDTLRMMALLAVTALSNAELHGRIERLSVTDGLTDLFNHQHFQDRLKKEIQRIERYPEKLTVMILDIDHFKKINDTYGHPAGDVVLRRMSAIMKKTLRTVDLPARYGGEEFAAILIKTGRSGARKLAERLRKRVGEEKFRTDAGDIHVTVSIGLAGYPDDTRDANRIIELADNALYHSKHAGRNRVTSYDEIQELSGKPV